MGRRYVTVVGRRPQHGQEQQHAVDRRIDRPAPQPARRDARPAGRGRGRDVSQIPLPATARDAGPSTLTFKELAHTLDDKQHVAEGYDMQVVIR
jgi:hypothetical protein